MPRIRMTERIAKTASITERLDKIASELEQVNPQMALAIDLVSDRLEGREANISSDDIKKKFEEIKKDLAKEHTLRRPYEELMGIRKEILDVLDELGPEASKERAKREEEAVGYISTDEEILSKLENDYPKWGEKDLKSFLELLKNPKSIKLGEDAPCRSCKFFKEGKLEHIKDGPSSLEGSCKLGISSKSYETYGVKSQEQGESKCGYYMHKHIAW